MRSKLSQLIIITLDRSFRMKSICFFEQGLRGKRSQTCPYMLSAKPGSIWYHFYNVFGTYDTVRDRTHHLPLTGRTLYHWATVACFNISSPIISNISRDPVHVCEDVRVLQPGAAHQGPHPQVTMATVSMDSVSIATVTIATLSLATRKKMAAKWLLLRIHFLRTDLLWWGSVYLLCWSFFRTHSLTLTNDIVIK